MSPKASIDVSPEAMLRFLRAGLEKVDTISTRQVQPRKWEDYFPTWGKGLRKDGSAWLALSVREKSSRMTLGGIRLSGTELELLAPPAQAKMGTRYQLPEEVCKQFVSATSPFNNVTVLLAEHAQVTRLAGVVVATDARSITVRLTGQFEANKVLGATMKTTHGQGTAEGYMEFDSAGRLLSLILIVDGTYRMAAPYDKDQPLTSTVEWVRSTDARAVASDQGNLP